MRIISITSPISNQYFGAISIEHLLLCFTRQYVVNVSTSAGDTIDSVRITALQYVGLNEYAARLDNAKGYIATFAVRAV